jgi:amino acid permease
MSGGLRRRLWRSTFAVPALLALATLVGLVVALVDDGAADIVGWVGLALPLVAIALAWRRAAPRR